MNCIINVCFVFSVGESVVRVCDALRIIRIEADVMMQLEDPRLITCTVLRKYIATVTQVLITVVYYSYWKIIGSI